MTATSTDLRERRETTVREHMDAENRHDFRSALGTFDHPRYELVPTGEVFDGAEEVGRYYEETRTAFPDQRNRVLAVHHADDAVIVEFELSGAPAGSQGAGVDATGRGFTCRMVAIFLFAPGGDRVTCERIYFDLATILTQLGVAATTSGR
jgi:steroid delta-isomerase-like uncharacterized protein